MEAGEAFAALAKLRDHIQSCINGAERDGCVSTERSRRIDIPPRLISAAKRAVATTAEANAAAEKTGARLSGARRRISEALSDINSSELELDHLGRQLSAFGKSVQRLGASQPAKKRGGLVAQVARLEAQVSDVARTKRWGGIQSEVVAAHHTLFQWPRVGGTSVGGTSVGGTSVGGARPVSADPLLSWYSQIVFPVDKTRVAKVSAVKFTPKSGASAGISCLEFVVESKGTRVAAKAVRKAGVGITWAFDGVTKGTATRLQAVGSAAIEAGMDAAEFIAEIRKNV